MEDLDGIRPYATAFQRRVIDTVKRHNGRRDRAAAELGVSPSGVRRSICMARKRAARAGWSPAHDMTRTVPEGFSVAGVSTLYDGHGDIKAQWVKSRADAEQRMSLLREAVEDLAAPFKGKARPAKPPKAASLDRDSMSCIVIGDAHLGLLSWGEETGDDQDTATIESELVEAADRLVSLSPATEECLIVSVGDYYHWDGGPAQTPQSGNSLDVDSRWHKVFRAGVRAQRRIIDQALLKHRRVRVILAVGNHDPTASMVLAACLAAFYDKEKRVTIDTSPGPFYWHRFGQNLIGVHHGDKAPPERLLGVMATDRAKDWGETSHRYWLLGHVHHKRVVELPGVLVESFRTLAGRDAWHHAQGYRSGRELVGDVYHKDHGRIERRIMSIGRVRS